MVAVLTDIGLLATPVPGERQGVLRTVPDAVLAWADRRIVWAGPRHLLPTDLGPPEGGHDNRLHSRVRRFSAQGALVVPGLVDSHTHLAFAGWRALEFEQRILGRSYLEIARAGGGIQHTVALTRKASDEELTLRARKHLAMMASLGTTTVECKSGYGLDVEHELRLLRIYRRLADEQPLRIVPTLLGAHTIPLGYRDHRDGYVRLVCDQMIPQAASERLAHFCDVFLEESAFSAAEARQILTTAAAAGLRAKVHADQLSDGGGAALAAEMNAVSADHLEHVSADGILELAAAGTVAVSLPLATLYLGQHPIPARRLLDAGVPVAVATDFNPGSAPSYHLPLAMLLACTLQRMTPSEVLWGATLGGAMALGLQHETGTLQAGYAADFAVIDAPDVDHWIYQFRPNACTQTWVAGQRIY